MKAATTIARFRREVADKCADPRSIMLAIRLLLFRLADDADFAQLADGKRLRDGLDFAAWLRELEAVVALELQLPEIPARVARFCHTCGHVHRDKECGMEMGQDRVCKCDVEVGA